MSHLSGIPTSLNLSSVELRPIAGDYPPLPTETSTRYADLPPLNEQDYHCYAAARRYLSSILPNIAVQPLSTKGTTAIVMHDGRHAYKIFRSQSRAYTDIENEVAALQVMDGEGITVSPIALLDAAPNQRYNSENEPHVEPLFDGKVLIPHIQGVGHLPVIITKLRELLPITEMPRGLLIPEFRRIAAAMIKHDLAVADGKFFYDPVYKEAVAVDLGYACHLGKIGAELVDKEIHEAVLIHDAFVRFCSPHRKKPTIREIARKLAVGGIESLDALLYEHAKPAFN